MKSDFFRELFVWRDDQHRVDCPFLIPTVTLLAKPSVQYVSLGVAFVLVIALCVRVAAVHVWQSQADAAGDVFRFGDSHSYWILATRIAKGEPYQYGSIHSRVFRAPLYPITLAPWTQPDDLRQAVVGARYQGVLLGLICVGLVMASAYQLAGARSALVAGVLAALYPGAIGMSVILLSEAVFCPLMMLSLYWTSLAITDSSDRVRYRWWLAAGIASGLACLARPSWFLWPAMVFFLCMLFSSHRRRNLQGSIAMILGVSFAMCPWWYRNFVETGKFVPTTLQVGASLYDGWHPGATGASDEDMNFVDRFASEQQEEDRKNESTSGNGKLDGTFEYRLDRRMHRAAVQWASENPSDVLRLCLVKFVKTWNPMPTAEQIGNRFVRYGEAIGYVTIFIAGMLGWWRMKGLGWQAAIFALPCLYFGVLHAIFIGSVRYRQPAILALCVLAGCVVAYWWSSDGKQEARSNPS